MYFTYSNQFVCEFCHGWWWRHWSRRSWKAPTFLKERQQHSHLRCPGVLLRLVPPCLSIHFDRCQQHSSQERPMKVLTTLLWLLSSAIVITQCSVSICLCVPLWSWQLLWTLLWIPAWSLVLCLCEIGRDLLWYSLPSALLPGVLRPAMIAACLLLSCQAYYNLLW